MRIYDARLRSFQVRRSAAPWKFVPLEVVSYFVSLRSAAGREKSHTELLFALKLLRDRTT